MSLESVVLKLISEPDSASDVGTGNAQKWIVELESPTANNVPSGEKAGFQIPLPALSTTRLVGPVKAPFAYENTSTVPSVYADGDAELSAHGFGGHGQTLRLPGQRNDRHRNLGGSRRRGRKRRGFPAARWRSRRSR